MRCNVCGLAFSRAVQIMETSHKQREIHLLAKEADCRSDFRFLPQLLVTLDDGVFNRKEGNCGS